MPICPNNRLRRLSFAVLNHKASSLVIITRCRLRRCNMITRFCACWSQIKATMRCQVETKPPQTFLRSATVRKCLRTRRSSSHIRLTFLPQFTIQWNAGATTVLSKRCKRLLFVAGITTLRLLTIFPGVKLPTPAVTNRQGYIIAHAVHVEGCSALRNSTTKTWAKKREAGNGLNFTNGLPEAMLHRNGF